VCYIYTDVFFIVNYPNLSEMTVFRKFFLFSSSEGSTPSGPSADPIGNLDHD